MELSPAARAFVERSRVGRLATTGADGTRHVVPVCFVPVGGYVYSVVDERPKRTTRLQRLRNIEARPHAAVVIARYDEDWSRLAWVMLRGPASVLEGGDEHPAALDALRAKYAQYREMELAGRPMIRLELERVNEWGLDA